MLECCEPLEVVKQRGIAFDQFVCLAECHGLEAVARRFDHTYNFRVRTCKLQDTWTV